MFSKSLRDFRLIECLRIGGAETANAVRDLHRPNLVGMNGYRRHEACKDNKHVGHNVHKLETASLTSCKMELGRERGRLVSNLALQVRFVVQHEVGSHPNVAANVTWRCAQVRQSQMVSKPRYKC